MDGTINIMTIYAQDKNYNLLILNLFRDAIAFFCDSITFAKEAITISAIIYFVMLSPQKAIASRLEQISFVPNPNRLEVKLYWIRCTIDIIPI